MGSTGQLIKKLLPNFIISIWHKVIEIPFIKKVRDRRNVKKLYSKEACKKSSENSDLQFANRSPKEVFTEIYEKQLWGKDESEEFYSGSGSHTGDVVDVYVSAVQSFLKNLPYKPNGVDLGCGDFNVGMKVRSLCDHYIACDVVRPLIERNKLFHKDLDVDFICLDICDDILPSGDVVFVRQVFQHLSNQQILSVVSKLSIYKYLILSEGLPPNRNFIANIDKPIGDGIRCFRGEDDSGIVLTLPPFNLFRKSETILCEVPVGDLAIIRTTAYKLQ